MPLTKEGSDKPDFHFVIAFVLEYKKRVMCTNIGGGNVLSIARATTHAHKSTLAALTTSPPILYKLSRTPA